MTHAIDRRRARHRPATLFGVIVIVIGLALAAGCSIGRKTEPVVAPTSLIQAPGKSSVTVSDADAGASIVLERAQALVVRLPIGATRGFEWSLVDLKPGVLAPQGPTFERAPRDVNVDEAAGTSIWHFAPEAAGHVALNFQLRRLHSLAPAVQVVAYSVTVK